jgi:hypothetical protein
MLTRPHSGKMAGILLLLLDAISARTLIYFVCRNDGFFAIYVLVRKNA